MHPSSHYSITPSPQSAKGGSSIGRVAVSKTVGWGFESLPTCHFEMKSVEQRMKNARSAGRHGSLRFCIPHSAFCISWRGGRVVYCGGLENRFGFTADGGSNPSLSAIVKL